MAETLASPLNRSSDAMVGQSQAPAVLGRKLLPRDNPVGPVEQFSWLVRSIRAFHHDYDMRETSRFAKALAAASLETLKVSSINRLETGRLDFTLERCVSYEQVLGIQANSLVDSYLWCMRNSSCPPKMGWSGLREPQSTDLDLLWRLAKSEKLQPLEWLRLSCLYRNRQDLFSSSLRLTLFEKAVDDLAYSAECDQRIMREALIRMGEDIVPVVLQRVLAMPIRNFVAVEALGYMTGEASWRALLRLQDSLMDSWTMHAIMESIQRRLHSDSRFSTDHALEAGGLSGIAASALADTGELFMAREACLELVRQPATKLTARQRSGLNSVREDLLQLSVRPVNFHRKEVVNCVVDGFGSLMLEERSSERIPAIVPGLSTLVDRAIFASNRQDRIAIGVLLSPWTQSSQLTGALGDALLRVPTDDYGTQRSIVRFATKLSSSRFHGQARTLAAKGVRDEGTSLSLAWALGMAKDSADEDEKLLRRMYSATSSVNTRRAIQTAAARRGFASVV